jgi:hypothetical protein
MLLLWLFFLLFALVAVMHAEAVLAEVVDIVVLVQERQANLADGQSASEAMVVVLLVGSGQAVSQEKVLQSFGRNFGIFALT